MSISRNYYYVVLMFLSIFIAQPAVAQEAAPLPPPLLCVDAIDCASAPGEGYSLGPLPLEFNDLRWPEKPSVNETIIVANSAELEAALQINGVRITILPGVYSGVTIRGSDQELIFEPGARINAEVHAVRIHGARRVAIYGGEWLGALETGSASSDVLIDGVALSTHRSGAWSDGIEFHSISRLAVVNSYFSARRFSAYVSPGNTDLIFLNNVFESDGPESTMRFQNVVRSVVVGNIFRNNSKHNFRAHDSSDLIYFARNQLETTGLMLENMNPAPQALRVWIVDNIIYHQSNSIIQIGRYPDVLWLYATGNVSYTVNCSAPGGCGEAIPVDPANWGEISNNPVLPYRSP